MTPMFRAIRTAAVLLLTGIVSAGSAFAPEHVHERDDHHPNATVHRHFAPHHARHGSDDARLDDDDDHVIWLTTAWLQADVYHGPSLVSTRAINPSRSPKRTPWPGSRRIVRVCARFVRRWIWREPTSWLPGDGRTRG